MPICWNGSTGLSKLDVAPVPIVVAVPTVVPLPEEPNKFGLNMLANACVAGFAVVPVPEAVLPLVSVVRFPPVF